MIGEIISRSRNNILTLSNPPLQMLTNSDKRALFFLSLCGFLIFFRFVWFFPGNWKLLLNIEAHTCCASTFLFFVWNLFLAALPYLFARMTDWAKSLPLVGVLLLFWLLFLPNAPYVISDLKHLRPRYGVPYPYDVVVFITCAFTGLYLGGLSIVKVMQRVDWQNWRMGSKALSFLVFPLAGFGIFLGRVLRWNSWDLFQQPIQLFSDIVRVTSDANWQGTIFLFTVGYGLALLAGTGFVLRTSK